MSDNDINTNLPKYGIKEKVLSNLRYLMNL